MQDIINFCAINSIPLTYYSGGYGEENKLIVNIFGDEYQYKLHKESNLEDFKKELDNQYKDRLDQRIEFYKSSYEIAKKTRDNFKTLWGFQKDNES